MRAAIVCTFFRRDIDRRITNLDLRMDDVSVLIVEAHQFGRTESLCVELDRASRIIDDQARIRSMKPRRDVARLLLRCSRRRHPRYEVALQLRLAIPIGQITAVRSDA